VRGKRSTYVCERSWRTLRTDTHIETAGDGPVELPMGNVTRQAQTLTRSLPSNLEHGVVVADSSSPGALVGGCFRIQSELGQGGMARVYRVVDERSGARLALKKLLASDESAAARAMFAHEYHTLAQLDHPHIVRVSDYGLDADGPYYTMELLEGADARATTKRGLLNVQRACSVLRDVASALALIHSRRLLHRDLSPRNVWCGEDGRAKLLDFGTLMPMGPQSKVAGTPPYVPPEAVHAQPLDARADL
jgi:serine/threonine protein kinase